MSTPTTSRPWGSVPPVVAAQMAKSAVGGVVYWLENVEANGDVPAFERETRASWRNLERLQASLRRLATRLDGANPHAEGAFSTQPTRTLPTVPPDSRSSLGGAERGQQ